MFSEAVCGPVELVVSENTVNPLVLYMTNVHKEGKVAKWNTENPVGLGWSLIGCRFLILRQLRS